jgi:hypothetical protein
MSETQYVIRTQGNRAHEYGLGEVVSPGVTLFRDGNYDLSLEEAQAKLSKATTPKKGH